jgi:type 1 fimbria pilin
VKRTLKKRSKVLEAGKRERYDGSDCAQQLTPYAEDSAGYTVVYAPEYLVVEVDGGTLLCRELMTSKTWSRKFIAVCVAVAVLSVYSMVVLAAPGAKASGELSVSGQVTVNGQKVISGGTLFSDSTISTADQSSASVSIGKLGRVELSANSNLRLTFTDNSINAMLETGSAHVSTLTGVSVNLTTKDGTVVVDGSKATSFTVNASRGRTSISTEAGLAQLRSGGTVKQIAAGESAMAGTPNPQDKDDEGGIHGGALAVLLLAVGGAVAAVIYATTHNNDLNFDGSVTVVSPTK